MQFIAICIASIQHDSAKDMLGASGKRHSKTVPSLAPRQCAPHVDRWQIVRRTYRVRRVIEHDEVRELVSCCFCEQDGQEQEGLKARRSPSSTILSRVPRFAKKSSPWQ